MASRYLGHAFHRLLFLLLLELQSPRASVSAIPVADEIRKRAPQMSSLPSPTVSSPAAVSTSPSAGRENPRLSLALKICFGLFAAIFTLSIIFCAVRSARRGRREPKVDDIADVQAEALREITANTAVEEEAETEAQGGLEERQQRRVRMPRRALVAEERVMSWVMEQEELVNYSHGVGDNKRTEGGV